MLPDSSTRVRGRAPRGCVTTGKAHGASGTPGRGEGAAGKVRWADEADGQLMPLPARTVTVTAAILLLPRDAPLEGSSQTPRFLPEWGAQRAQPAIRFAHGVLAVLRAPRSVPEDTPRRQTIVVLPNCDGC